MRKITLFFTFFLSLLFSSYLTAQHTFTTIAGPTLVANGTPVTLSINDIANTSGVTIPSTFTYSSFTISANWENVSGSWSSEADLKVVTAAGTVTIDPPTSGSGSSSVATTLTFDGDFVAPYDPATDGSLDIVLNQSWSGSSANWSNIIVTINPTPACITPTGLLTSNITDTQVQLDWDDMSGVSQFDFEYAIQLQGVGTPTINGVLVSDDITATATTDLSGNPLLSNTAYEVWLRSDCGVGAYSEWFGPVNFTTACSVYSIPTTEDFTTYVPGCWQEADNGDLLAGPDDFGSSAWISDGFANNGDSGAAKINIYSTGKNDWILSPLYNIAASGYELKFAAAATQYASTNAPTTAWEADDFVEVLVSTDFTNWTVLYTFNDTNTPSNMGSVVIVDLEAYAGQNVRFAFRGVEGSVDGSADIDFSIDDFEIRLTPTAPPACVSNLVATPDVACGNFASAISWDAVSGADGYKITMGTTSGGNDILNNVDLGDVLNYSYVGLINTSYYVTVLSYNSFGNATACSEITFTTNANGCYCTSNPSSIDNNGVTNVQIVTTDFPNSTVSYTDNTSSPVDVYQGLSNNVQITYETGYTYDTHIWVDLNDDFVFDATELMYSGTSTNVSPSNLDASFVVPSTLSLGQHRMRIGSADSGQATPNPCYSGSFGVTIDFVINVVAPPCVPTGVSSTTIVADCVNSQYSIDVAVSSLGDGTPVITDGTNTWPVTSTGVVTVGPFVSGATVSLTLLHGSESVCDVVLGSFNYGCPPSNDECNNAIALTVNADLNCAVVTAGTNFYATASSQADDVTGTPNNDVWFSFVAVEAAHTIVISNVVAVSGSSVDMGMGVYDAITGCSALSFVADSDPNTLALTGLTVGNTYLVRVYNWSSIVSNANTFDICVGTPPAPPVNDDCDNAIALTVNTDLNCGVVTSGTNQSATASSQADDVTGTPNNDVWFSFVAVETAHTIVLSNVVAVSGSSTNMGMGVYDATGGCSALTFFNDSDPNTLALTGLTVGNTYLVRVYNWSSTASNANAFNICVGTPPPPPSNDDCDNAIALTVNADLNCGVVTTGTNLSATASSQADDVTGTPNNDVWFSFVATAEAHTIALSNVVAVSGSSTDMGMGVYDATGGCTALTFFDDSDPNTLDLTGLTIGNTYLVRVYNWTTAASNGNTFDICIGTDPNLSSATFDQSSLKVYPNPISDVLNLEFSEEIKAIQVVNLLGQIVIDQSVNNTTLKIDMTHLNSGTYIVNILINDVMQTVKVIKN
ncbi:GEVED domain-containing protein [Flavobacterium chuncheonense]|uniref:GEVED domain-containing protein n=1 Tax=Flavobacterium chuncheonense TaxID=2026653 RepID=A0ABW5YKF7_9FLAO